MKAVLYESFAKPPKVVSVPDPRPGRDGVVIRLCASGVCRSDWHGWMGHDADIVLPHVPGHELAGTIEEVGENVTRWHPGDRVTVPFVAGCGACEECASGNQQVCRSHSSNPGSLHGVHSHSMWRSTMQTPTSCACPRRSGSTPPPVWAAVSPRPSEPLSTRAASEPANGWPSTAAAAWACRR
jgi:D-arabinose 1-dehydrogenase-like Zn-dependent alcohol dehydrogenase